MNKLNKMIGKMVATILSITLLTGCAAAGVTMGNALGTTNVSSTACHATGDLAHPYEEINITNDINPVPANGCPTGPVSISDGRITICHATGSESNPYDEITVSINGLDGHSAHTGDVFPAKAGGCPKKAVATGASKVTICHATGSETKPYEEITLSGSGLDGHDKHAGDIIPMPANGCPTSLVVISEGKITICHATDSETNPYNEIKVSVNGLDGHAKHAGDIIPMPENGCPTSLLVVKDGKITICHATSSATNPYNEITISVNGLNGHGKHADDIIPAPEGGCPKSPAVVSAGKITICHATGSKNNPYVEITISVNGLNGHGKHKDDIIPAPEGGCPTGKK
jgi:hypothetical protein